jgi:hypothetical protein
MLNDNGDNFCVVLNSQVTGQNVQAINSNGQKKYFNSFQALLTEQAKAKKYNVSINFVSLIATEATLSAGALYILEVATGNNVQTIYQNGSASNITNSVMIPLEVYPVVTSATDVVSSYWMGKTKFTGRCPTDVFEIRIRNASNFAIQSAFPNYVCQISFEEVLETKVF